MHLALFAAMALGRSPSVMSKTTSKKKWENSVEDLSPEL
jgi:hypothetical protein